MNWTLRRGDMILARISEVEPDMPWFDARFEPSPAFDDVRDLFAEELALMNEERWEEWDALWATIHEMGVVLVADDGTAERDFAVHVENGNCRFRY